MLTKEEEDGLVSYIPCVHGTARISLNSNSPKSSPHAIAVRSGKADRFGKESPSEIGGLGLGVDIPSRHIGKQTNLNKLSGITKSRSCQTVL